MTIYTFIYRIEKVHHQYLMRYPKDNAQSTAGARTSPAEADESDDDIFVASTSAAQANTFVFAGADKSFEYFQHACTDRHTDPMLAWDTELGVAYPSLSRMAFDMLSIPASSTSVERLFSVGGLIVMKRRNKLGSDSIRSLMCINRWLPDFGNGVIRAYTDRM